MNGIKWLLSCLVVLSAIGGSLAYGASILTLTTNPLTGELSGAPGQTVGWGFTLFNSSDNFALITSADFCGGVISSPCSTPLGTFTDFISQFNFTTINPHSSLSDAFNPISHTGIGSYTISPGAPKGSSFLGQIVLTYDTFPDSSLLNQIGFDDRTSAATSISVPPSAAVPEPDSLLLLFTSLAGLFTARVWSQTRTVD